MPAPSNRVGISYSRLRKLSQALRADLAVSQVYAGAQIFEFAIVDNLPEGVLRHMMAPYRAVGQELDPIIRFMEEDPRQLITVYRQDIMTDQQWYRSELFNEYIKVGGFDHGLYSRLRLPNGLIHRLAFGRALGERPFSAADHNRVAQFHRQVLARSAYEPAPLLSRRAREVLYQVMCGKTEKEIARWLGLNVATVHREVMAIYRHYEVHRKVELLTQLGAMDVQHQDTAACVQMLSPRERQAFSFLLAGANERHAASMLDLSSHTFHEYVKIIYQALGVNSRAQLIAKFGGLHLSQRAG